MEPAVLVIGCGPVGLFAAYLLGRRGVPTLIIDKHHTRRGQPKAHALNPRTLEIFRQSGLDVPHLRSVGIDPKLVDVVRFVDNFYGWEYGHLNYERQFDDIKPLTPEPLLNIVQPAVEEYLLAEVSKLSSVTVQRGVEWLSAHQGENVAVTSRLLDRASEQESTVVTKYILACDGGRSTFRSSFDIGFYSIHGGPGTEKNHVTVHFRAVLPGKRSGILFFNMQPHGVRAFIRYGEDEWVFVRRFDPATESPAFFDEASCCSIVQEALGRAEPVEILSTTIWQSSTRIAEAYRPATVPNAFLAGDAAHTFPPTGGLGVNTGFADIHNLIWKLDIALQGIDSETLLATYEDERRPIATQNASQSSLNEERMDELGVRINPGGSAQRPERLTDPTFVQQVQEGIQWNEPHFDSLDLQLGYIYGRSRDPLKNISEFQSTFAVGARLPHVFIGCTQDTSVLDLVQGERFTLLLPTEEIWLEMKTCLSTHLHDWVVAKILGKDFQVSDSDAGWVHGMFSPSLNRAALIRPDQHIADFVQSGTALAAALASFFSK
ncbi:FAD binding domain-containing protein [Aspergillus pseudoustus]|uniref:FAD binding domain-containing protein n=1 Tax=Aspergillus pseudoustus TaxID=1810923 RepID=A0ABR4IGN4_9EURO